MTEPALKVVDDREIKRGGNDLDLIPRMVSTPKEMKARLQELQEFVKEVMVEGVDFGPPFPGSDKNVLLKPGAEKLAEIYGYSIEPNVVQRVEHWGPTPPAFFHYEFEARIVSKRTGVMVGKGVGSCNTMENRYRWRNAGRTCPACGKEGTIIKGKEQYGGGWLCFGKKGGCGAKFKEGDAAIERQEVGKVENDDVQTLANTALKIAKKRAYIDGIISVTQSAGLFTGEDEDGDEDERGAKSNRGASGKTTNGDHAAAKKDDGRVEITAWGKTYRTLGITSPTFIRVHEAIKAYDAAFPETPGAAKAKIAELVGKGSTLDLTEAEGKIVDTALRGILDGPHPADQGSDANEELPY